VFATYRTGPFVVRLQTPIRQLMELVDWCYGLKPVGIREPVPDFHVSIQPGPLFRRFLAPQARFRTDVPSPLEPFPLDHAFPLLEWGLNWCVASRAHQYLMLHAGVLERGGYALILPALPGSGKSTLSAALALSGWRLLSDEFALVNCVTGSIEPMPRAVPLKNESIQIIRDFSSKADLGPDFPRTRKGRVVHLRPMEDSLARQDEPARPAWIVFPRFSAGGSIKLNRLTKSLAFTRLAQNSFNYRLLGATGFTALRTMIETCRSWSAEYGELESILAAINSLPPAPE
jgi:HprK-related kinase A